MLKVLFSQIESRPLGLARVIVGSAAVLRVIVVWQVLSDLTRPEVLQTPYLPWMPEPSTTLAVVITGVWLTAAVLFTLGWKVPITGSLLFASIVFTLALDQQTYSNHLYLMAWLVLLLTIAGAGSALNVHRRDRPVTRWPVLLIMSQLSIVYGFSGLTKINEDFLSGSLLAGTLGTGLVPFPESLRTPSFLSLVAAVAVATELFIAIFIWRKSFRPAAFVLGLGLHAGITLFMFGTLQLLVFSLLMLALYPLFLIREPLVVVWDDECASCRDWIARFGWLDVLKTLDPVGKHAPRNPISAHQVERSMHLLHDGETSSGFRAVLLILEHLIPTLWFASVLRLPGIRNIGERWYRWQARRRSCPAGDRPTVITGDSKGR